MTEKIATFISRTMFVMLLLAVLSTYVAQAVAGQTPEPFPTAPGTSNWTPAPLPSRTPIVQPAPVRLVVCGKVFAPGCSYLPIVVEE